MMKKILVAASIAAMSTVATAQVSLSGKISVWGDNTKVGNASSATTMWNEPTNNVAINAQEKLGNGLTARAVVETSLHGNTLDNTGTRLGDRQATVGLAGKMGSLDLGRNVHSQFLAVANNDAFSTLYGSVAGDVHNLRGLRISDGTFVSVTAIPGLTVSYDRSQTPGLEATAASVGGSVGPVKAVVARYELNNEVSTVYGLNGKVGSTQLFYSHSDNQGVLNSKGHLVGARHPLGAFIVKGSYGQTDTDVKAYSVGLDYALSKRTEVGVAYRNVDKLAVVHDVKQIGVGLTHRF